jgi:RNA 2',3'-cyclic 3'-phosphodiesterase
MNRLIRSFIALPLPGASRDALGRLQAQLQPMFPGFRWINPDSLHLTLRFLGEIPEDSLEKLGKIVLSVADSSSSFQLTSSGLDAFPSWHHGRIVWLGLRASDPVSQLYRRLSAGLQHMGIPEERHPFHPHLTLGRSRQIKSLPSLPIELQRPALAEFTVDRLVLYQSRLTPQGAIHSERRVGRFAG